MPRHLAPQIAQDIGARITAGALPAGTLLPNERSLAQEHGVARNTIRNALALLERDGLITRHVGRGTIVKGPASTELLSLVDKIAGAAPIDILNLRLIVEPQVTALAAISCSAEDLAGIADANTNMMAAPDHDSFERWDNEVHSRIYEAARNSFLLSLHRILSVIRSRTAMQELRRRSFNALNRQIYCEQHEEIIDALRHRDRAAASAAMRTHLATRKRIYFGD
ncbi:FadR/GntR family transcriptional regulator [Aestuariivirga sp.]|uniref:FadR/GntR family transcriptional regulator n=1 Tax=Aestuariivirga sp. TaxID=2650926 RepID=UPI003BAA17DF